MNGRSRLSENKRCVRDRTRATRKTTGALDKLILNLKVYALNDTELGDCHHAIELSALETAPHDVV